MKEFLNQSGNIEEELTRLQLKYGVHSIDEKLHKELSELSVFVNLDLHTWFLSFLDQEQIHAPVSRIFLKRTYNNDHTPILVLIQLLHFLDQEIQEESIGLKIGSYVLAKYGGVLGHLCLSSENFGEVIARFHKYYQLMFEGFRLQVIIDDTQMFMSWDLIKKLSDVFAGRRIGCIFVDLCVSSLFSIASRLFNHQYAIHSSVVLMGKAPENVLAYQQFFRCPVSFGADFPTVTMPLSLLSLPINVCNDKLKLLVKIRLQAEMNMHPVLMTDHFLHEFQKVLLCALHDNRPNINYVAEKLALSRANLQRKLQERSLSFSELLDKTRLKLAKMYLEHNNLPMTEIAWLLAFSDQTAFSRSFKRWTGLTPIEYRKLLIK
ncbi:MAG: AraC family transcriptional regulator ligand-binding domain-containing protein [Moraxellaceae bacterium]|nr:AraC family transcriptional regulator ligand-binding domain-containing protein [Moraxellaceae bacterium]